MKVNVLGVKRIFGTGKTGNQFDMCVVSISTPMKPGAGGKVTVLGYGHEVTEIPCDAEALPAFASLSLPGVYDLQIDQRPNRGELESVVVGVVPVAALAKAA